ncbi:MAG: sulfatase [Myxococcota bacterium]
MLRKRWVLLAGLVGLGCGAPAPAPAPDVVLVVVDTLRADHLGAYGFPLPTSPNLDRFAEDAVVFERAIAASASTVPSHASLMTSRFVREHSVGWVNGTTRLEGAVTLAERFREAGWATGAFVSNFVLRRASGLDAGFDVYDDAFSAAEPNRPGFYERAAPATTARARAWLGDRADEPVFLFVHYQDPHGPYLPPAEWLEAFASLETTDAAPLPLLPGDDEPGGIPRYQALPGLDRLGQYARRYAGEIAYFDASFAELLAALEARGRPNVVLVTADHGESFGEGGFYLNHGHATTPDQAHVPLLLRAPGIAAGRRRDPVHHVDVAPTLLALAGLAVPGDVRGLALGAFLERGERLPERLLFSDVGSDVTAYGEGRLLRARRSGPLGPFAYAQRRWDAGEGEPIPTRPDDLEALDAYLAESEPRVPIPKGLSDADRARLRALGYLGDE